LLFFAFFSLIVEDNDELGGSSSSLGFFSLGAKNNNESRSRLIVILGCFVSIVEDDNESKGLSSFIHFFP
jgi:hypothetical protein